MKMALQTAIIALVRPYVFREAPGWGKVCRNFIGSCNSNDLWKAADERIIAGKRHGLLMALNLSNWSERYAFFLGRWYDLPNQLLIDAVLKPGDDVIDIGGNIGMFSLAAAAQIGPEGRIAAFEPNPAPRAKFQRHIDINGLTNITIHPYALHDKEGVATLNIPKINTGEGSLSKLNGYHAEDTVCIDVEIKVADDVLENFAPRLVKIDVEGAEIGVLKGMDGLIQRARPLISAEYVPEHLARFGSSFADFDAFAKRHRYVPHRLSMQKIRGRQQLLLSPMNDPACSGDIVLIPENDHSLDAYTAA